MPKYKVTETGMSTEIWYVEARSPEEAQKIASTKVFPDDSNYETIEQRIEEIKDE